MNKFNVWIIYKTIHECHIEQYIYDTNQPLRSVCASTQRPAAAARKNNDAAVDDIMSPIFPEEIRIKTPSI